MPDTRKLDAGELTDFGERATVEARYWAVDEALVVVAPSVPVAVVGGEWLLLAAGGDDDGSGGGGHEAGLIEDAVFDCVDARLRCVERKLGGSRAI